MVNLSSLILASFVSSVIAIDCSVPELSKYNLQLLKGTQRVTIEEETPPTKTKTTWSFAVCDEIKDVPCESNSDICGATEVEIDGKYQITQLIPFQNLLTKVYTPLANEREGIQIEFKDAKWGSKQLSAKVSFVCPSDEDSESLDQFKVKSFNNNELVVEVLSKAGCVRAEGDKDNDNNNNKDDKKDPPKKDDKGESWGWFTWIFIFLVLFLSIYIIGGAWFQYHKSNSIDFQSALREVLENFVDLLRGLPQFIKEIVEKVTGNNTRGEYSAV